MSLAINAAINGFLMAISLISPVGNHNTFIIRKALLKDRIGIIVAVCVITDIILISFGAVLSQYKGLFDISRWIGVVLLVIYSALTLKRLFSPLKFDQDDDFDASNSPSVKKVVTSLLSLTCSKPYLYLTTILLLGSFSTQYGHIDKWCYAIGAFIESFVWFYLLGFRPNLILKIFTKPVVLRAMDCMIFLVMLWCMYKLLHMEK